MNELSGPGALAEAERLLEKDRLRVTQLLALRASQVKHVVNQLRLHEQETGSLLREEDVVKLSPPMSSEKLIPYALEMHAFFTMTIFPRLDKNNHPHVKAWNTELDNTLLEMRRIVMQNLSKHPAMKPFQVLNKLESVMGVREKASRVRWEKERDRALQERRKNSVADELRALREEEGYSTLALLEKSRDELLRQKKELMESWLGVWKSIEPFVSVLSQKTKVFAKMENAQLRVVQLYLANPLSARAKDAHGAGLLMLLRLSVEALEEKKTGIPKEEREKGREALSEALQNPFFANYFEYVHGLDVALEGNQREYNAHPLYVKRFRLELEMQDAERKWEEANRAFLAEEKKVAEVESQIRSLEKEADEVCRMHLGFSVARSI